MELTAKQMLEEIEAKQKYLKSWLYHIKELSSISWNLSEKSADRLEDIQEELRALVVEGAKKVKKL